MKNENKRKNRWGVLAALTLAIVIVTGCGSNSSGQGLETSSEAAVAEVEVTTEATAELVVTTIVTTTTETVQTTTEATTETTMAEQETVAENAGELVDGMRPEFKEAMDAYEAFYEDYCSFVEQYAENPSDLSLIAKYSDLVAQSSEMDEKFDAWEEEDLNDAEMQYYWEVNGRVLQRLGETTSSLY